MHFFFYLFAFLILFSALLAVSSKNPIYSVLYLIFSFLNAGALFIILNAEFLSMVLIIVYVGAIAVLFLFIVMMLNVTQAEKNEGFTRHYLVVIFLCGFLGFSLVSSLMTMTKEKIKAKEFEIKYNNITIYDIGKVLYTDYIYVFELSGVILLLAMFSVISLTLHKKKDYKRQNVHRQIRRSSVVRLIDMPNNSGINIENNY